MDRIPITKDGYKRIKEELLKLKTVDRKSIGEAIKEARGHGDLSENAEYEAAKERQAFTEGRISDLERKVPLFDIIDITSISNDKVQFGSIVTLENLVTGEKKIYSIVGPDEANISEGKISVYSPIARAIVGKEVGAEATVIAPSGDIEYLIEDIRH